MDLELTDDQRSLQQSFAELFAKEAGSDRVRRAEPLGHDPDLWRVLVSSEVPTMGVPDALGGGGASAADLVVVATEAGRRIAPAPLVEVLAAADVLARHPAGTPLLDAVGMGAVLPTLAVRPMRDGIASQVPAGAVADLVVVLDGDELVALRRPAPGTGPANLGSAPLADVRAAAADERIVLGSGPQARAAHADGVALWRLLMAAQLDGLRQEALRIGVEYVNERRAFGVQIGWFQVVQHRLADLVTAGEGGELLLHKAAWARDTGAPDAAALAGMALLHAADTAFQTCRASLQYHGGYGFTLEYDIQLYYRRAKAWPLAGGAPRHVHRELADLLFPQGVGQEEG